MTNEIKTTEGTPIGQEAADALDSAMTEQIKTVGEILCRELYCENPDYDDAFWHKLPCNMKDELHSIAQALAEAAIEQYKADQLSRPPDHCSRSEEFADKDSDEPTEDGPMKIGEKRIRGQLAYTLLTHDPQWVMVQCGPTFPTVWTVKYWEGLPLL